MTQFAAFHNVPFSDLAVEARLVWDNRRKYNILDMAQASLGFVFRVSMTSDQPLDDVKRVFREAEEGCYASDAIRNPVPMRAHLLVNGEEVLVDKRGAEIPEVIDEGWQHRG